MLPNFLSYLSLFLSKERECACSTHKESQWREFIAFQGKERKKMAKKRLFINVEL